MQVRYKDKKLRELCEKQAVAEKKLGAASARKLKVRLVALEAATRVTDLVAGNEVMLFHQARQLGFSSDTFVTVATLADQDNCFAFNPAADKQQVARLQQALDKVRQGEAFKRLIARYQDVVQSPPADHLPTIE